VNILGNQMQNPFYQATNNGTGFVVQGPDGSNYIATAAHNFAEVDNRGVITTASGPATINFANTNGGSPTALQGQVVAANFQADVALVKLNGPLPPGVTPMPIANSNFAGGASGVLTVNGYPVNGSTVATGQYQLQGFTNGVTMVNGQPMLVSSSLASQPGYSGAPLVNSQGQVVGMTSYLTNTPTAPGVSVQNAYYPTSNVLSNLLQNVSGGQGMSTAQLYSGASNLPSMAPVAAQLPVSNSNPNVNPGAALPTPH
jgi:S1-C subfamily serine protease